MSFFLNPILNHDFPDPSILDKPDEDGWYYGYATQSRAMANIQVARSKNLVDWELLAHGALAEKPMYAQNSEIFWAPYTVNENGQYRLYYTTAPDNGQGLAISVTISDQPGSGFIDNRDQPLKQGAGYQVIDPHFLRNPKDGRCWLYWGSGHEPIYVQEMTEDGLDFKPGSQPIEVLRPYARSRYRRLLEGFYVIYYVESDTFFGFASGSNTWEWYGVTVYRAKSPEGPFEPVPNSLILRPNQRWFAPGQGSIIEDAAGQHWIYYHASDRRDSRNQFGSEEMNRPMCLARLDFINGLPIITGGTPALKTKATPTT